MYNLGALIRHCKRFFCKMGSFCKTEKFRLKFCLQCYQNTQILSAIVSGIPTHTKILIKTLSVISVDAVWTKHRTGRSQSAPTYIFYTQDNNAEKKNLWTSLWMTKDWTVRFLFLSKKEIFYFFIKCEHVLIRCLQSVHTNNLWCQSGRLLKLTTPFYIKASLSNIIFI